MHHYLSICPVSACTDTFESNTELDAHIAANLHNAQRNTRRATNDIARLHLIELTRKTNIDSQQQTTRILDNQSPFNDELLYSNNYQKFSAIGWELRTRKHSNPISDKIKNFIERLWLDSQEAHSRLRPEEVQQQIRTK